MRKNIKLGKCRVWEGFTEMFKSEQKNKRPGILGRTRQSGQNLASEGVLGGVWKGPQNRHPILKPIK